MEEFTSTLATFADPYLLGVIILGTLGGVIVGAMPGLSSTMATALLLPFTLTMEPVPAISLLSALYCAGTFGGSITAILVNAPGAPPAAATAFDGYPLAQKGFAGQMAPILTFLIMAPILYFAYPAIYEALGNLFREVDEGMLMWLLLVGVVALAIGVFALFSKLLAKLLEVQVSPRSDTAYGLVLGLVRGTFTALFVMIFLVMVGPPKFYESFSAKSYVGTLVCEELVPVIQPNFKKIVHSGKMRGAKDKLLEQEDAGVFF